MKATISGDPCHNCTSQWYAGRNCSCSTDCQRLKEWKAKIELDWKYLAENHAETLRGIANMDPATEGDRMKLWATDGLAGYTEPIESTLKKVSDERNDLQAELEQTKKALDLVLAKISCDECPGNCKRYQSVSKCIEIILAQSKEALSK